MNIVPRPLYYPEERAFVMLGTARPSTNTARYEALYTVALESGETAERVKVFTEKTLRDLFVKACNCGDLSEFEEYVQEQLKHYLEADKLLFEQDNQARISDCS